MGKLTDFANWTERKLKRAKDSMKPATFVQALEGHPMNMKAMLEEGKAYGVDWQVSIIGAAAKLAKADGVVSKQELAEVEKLFTMFEMTGDQRTRAIDYFNWAKNAPMSFYDTILAIRDIGKPDQETILILSLMMFRIGNADGKLSDVNRECLEDLCRIYGLSYDGCNEIYLSYRQNMDDEKEAYVILGCTPSDSDDTIKERYRNLVKDFHPDRISPKELAPDFLSFAEEKFIKIQSAYESVMQKRTKSIV